jgi:hypothetical protein
MDACGFSFLFFEILLKVWDRVYKQMVTLSSIDL